MVNNIILKNNHRFKVLDKCVRFSNDENMIYLSKEEFERCISFYDSLEE